MFKTEWRDSNPVKAIKTEKQKLLFLIYGKKLFFQEQDVQEYQNQNKSNKHQINYKCAKAHVPEHWFQDTDWTSREIAGGSNFYKVLESLCLG